MSSKNITVTIMAREFIVACPEGQEKSLLDSVQYLNQKIDLIQSQGSIVGIDRIIIMAALNITNELINSNTPTVKAYLNSAIKFHRLNIKSTKCLHKTKDLPILY